MDQGPSPPAAPTIGVRKSILRFWNHTTRRRTCVRSAPATMARPGPAAPTVSTATVRRTAEKPARRERRIALIV